MMTKISLDLDDQLNERLGKFALNRYGRIYGIKQSIIRAALISYLNQQESIDAGCQAVSVECVVEDKPVPHKARKIAKPTKPKKSAKM